MMFEKTIEATISGVLLKDYKNVVDFSVLSPMYSEKDLEKAANIAYKNRYRSLCVLPFAVRYVKTYINEKLQGALKVGTVVDFPLGGSVLPMKIMQAKHAFFDGADYIDAVINVSLIKKGDFGALKKEISRLVRTARRKEINIVLEASALSREEVEKVCKLCTKCKVDSVMTNTGFGSGGVSAEVVEVFVNSLGKKCGVKAAGGIATKEDAILALRAGATKIGTSREI